jgi:hypothetical protein
MHKIKEYNIGELATWMAPQIPYCAKKSKKVEKIVVDV